MAELCERAVNVFIPSASDRNGMESLLVQVGTDVKQHLTPVHVEAGKPLSECMIRRGEVFNVLFTAPSKPCSPGAFATPWPRCKRDGAERSGAIPEPAATPGGERGKRVSAKGGTEEMG